MKDSINELQKIWQEEQIKYQNQNKTKITQLMTTAQSRKKSSVRFQYGNVATLGFVLLAIVYFFSFYLSMREVLSQLGLTLMYGGLLFRIGIEIYSLGYARNIDMGESSLVNTESTLTYLEFRKRIHGSFTLIIVGLYTLGFYMLVPEFAMYMDTLWVILIAVSYLPAAIIPVWQIRKAIRKEVKELEELVRIREMMTKVADSH